MTFPAIRQSEPARRKSLLPRNRAWRAAWLLAVGLLLLGATVFAQESNIVVGTITYKNGRPAAGILVLIGQNYRYTDGGGRYRISNVPAGTQRMVCKRGSTVLWQGEVTISGPVMTLNRTLP